MSTEDREPKPKSSIEDRVRSNVAIWFLGAVATGFGAGIGAVKWSDERYKVEPISIADKNAFVKAQSDLVALQKAYKSLTDKNAELKEIISRQGLTVAAKHDRIAAQPVTDACISQKSELASLKDSYAKSQADLNAALKSCSGAVVASGIGIKPRELSQISITLTYPRKRVSEANLISTRLGSAFKDLQLVVCDLDCSRSAQIRYGYDLSAPLAFSVARLLTEAGVAEFSEPTISRGEGPHKMTIYLGTD
jgi:hypothetical protein